MADADVLVPRGRSIRKTLASFLIGVIIVRIVNISVRAVAKSITRQLDQNPLGGVSTQPTSSTAAVGACDTKKTPVIIADDSYIVYVEIFILTVILLVTYLYGQ